MRVQSFFVMDENFLLYRPRVLRLLELMETHDKAWSLQIFSSANAVRSYPIDQLVRLGLSWLWLGLEGERSQYSKLAGVDTFELVQQLRSHGVRVLGSSILGLEHHTPENIDRVIDYAVRHGCDFHQFMVYSPSPGTPLYNELAARGQLKTEEEFPWPDWHGQLGFSWRHPQIRNGQETEYLLRAFRRDFEVNGPSILRTMRTALDGWKRYQAHPDPRVRRRMAREAAGLAKAGAAAAAASREYYRNEPALHAQMCRLFEDLCGQFGDEAQHLAEQAVPYLLAAIRAEEKKAAEGWAYEPPTFYEINEACQRRFADEYREAAPCLSVTPSTGNSPAATENAQAEEWRWRRRIRQARRQAAVRGRGRHKRHDADNREIPTTARRLWIVDSPARPLAATRVGPSSRESNVI